jgi:acetylornithine aminotransferase/acetylornithine/N-succinyldiaminopimelate aminotransferase
MTPGLHGTTFGGGPLVCAVAIAVIDTMKQTGLLKHVSEVGGYFKQRLEWLKKRHDCVTEVRGEGLMLGLELESAELATRAAAEMMGQRIIINRTSETVLRFLPPFVLERAHVDTAIAALDGILTQLNTASAALAGEHAHGQ